ncbi:MAG: hypothetical protein HY868_16310 [Chloroflexi bacterium]|nr:hypothetical protein [Chloroflexota bacterium]
MKRTTLHIVLIVLALLVAGIVSTTSVAASPNAQTATAWTGFYYSNRNLQGNPVFTRDDPNINFVWGSGGPGGGIPGQNFSVRWIRWVYFDRAGNWTLTTITDDGVRLFVDDTLVIDQWRDQTTAAHNATVNLAMGFHLVKMEYYQADGTAEARLQIASASYPDWRGEYYNNPDLAGSPVFIRNDSAINFNFGTAGPGGGIPGVNFSVRWTRTQYFATGNYRFTTTTDDGARLWVDNQLIIDRWIDQGPTAWSGDIALTEGNHAVKMEYYQRGGAALAVLTWTTIADIETWHGEYFNNPNLSGAPTLFRDDTNLNFNWNGQSPGLGIPGTNWSARFTSRRNTHANGYYTVAATSDDGVRVWVDNNILIDQWRDQAPTTYAVTVYLNAGAHDWRVEYYQRDGGSMLRVTIASGVNPPPPPPPGGEVIVDVRNPGFSKGGSASGWHQAPNSYGSFAYWTENNTYAAPYYNWARWYPTLPAAGYYETFVYIPAGIASTRNARYWVQHGGAYQMRRVAQALYPNQWVSLGTYYFHARGGEYVSLSDVTYEPFLSTSIVFDAVKFVAR